MANNKYSFEYLLLAIIRKLAVLAYCEYFLVMINAIIQQIVTIKINTENFIYSILLKSL